MELLTKINWVDVVVIIIMVRISCVAFHDGLSHEIFPFLGALSSLIIALHYYSGVALSISQNVINIPVEILDPVGFIAISLGVGYIFKFLRIIVDKIIKVTWHPAVESLGGLIFGMLRAAVVTSLVLIIIAMVPASYLQRSIRDKSLMGMTFLSIGPVMYSKVSGMLPDITIGGREIRSDNIVQQIIAEKSVPQEGIGFGKMKHRNERR